MTPRTDADTLRAAIKASGLSARRFAVELMGRNERSVRRWLSGEPMPAVVLGWLKSYLKKALESVKVSLVR